MNTKMVAEGITIKYSMINMDKIHDAPTAIAYIYIYIQNLQNKDSSFLMILVTDLDSTTSSE